MRASHHNQDLICVVIGINERKYVDDAVVLLLKNLNFLILGSQVGARARWDPFHQERNICLDSPSYNVT